MRLKKGQIWVHRDSDATVDKILRVDETHWYSNVAKCRTENSRDVVGDAHYSSKKLLTDSRWMLADPWAMFNALCQYYFKPIAAVEPKPEPYIEVLLSGSLPMPIKNASRWQWNGDLLAVYDESNTVLAAFPVEDVLGVVRKGEKQE